MTVLVQWRIAIGQKLIECKTYEIFYFAPKIRNILSYFSSIFKTLRFEEYTSQLKCDGIWMYLRDVLVKTRSQMIH